MKSMILCGGLLSFAAYASLRLSYANWLFARNTLDSVTRAGAVDPYNWRYPAWLADLQENAGRDSSRALADAARLNPRDSALWIRRGLRAEFSGDRAEAERLLLHAAAVDRLMEPRWTLMNFYFRAGDEAKFWPWAERAFAMSYDDRTPLLDLCWRVREDPARIAGLFAGNYPVKLQFLKFLLARQQFEPAGALALTLLSQASLSDRPLFLACVQQLIDSGKAGAARQLWNGLGARLDQVNGPWLTNGEFERYPSGTGFDWRLPENAGVTAILARGGELRVALNGKQNEACDLLTQTVPLERGRSYRLKFAYKTSGLGAASGLRVSIFYQATRELSSEEWQDGELRFAAIGDLGTIALEYRRPPGAMRAEGRIALRRFALEAVP